MLYGRASLSCQLSVQFKKFGVWQDGSAVKVLVDKPDDRSLNSGTQMVEGEK